MMNELEIGKNAAKKAGDVIKKYYKTNYEIKEKGYKNPVTTADFEADKIIKDTFNEQVSLHMVGYLKKR